MPLWEDLCSRAELKKYLSAEIDDFMEEFPRLPPDANPLDPQFADPRALLPVVRGAEVAAMRAVAGPRRLNHNRRVVVNRGRGEVNGDDEEAHMLRQLAQFEAQDAELMEQMMRQEQEIGLLNQYAGNANAATANRRNTTLLSRISGLPQPLKDFLCNIIEQRIKASNDDNVDGNASLCRI